MNTIRFFALIFLIGCQNNNNVENNVENHVEKSDVKKMAFKTVLKSEIHDALISNKKITEEGLFLLAKLYAKNNQNDSAIFYINTIIELDSSANIFNEPSFYLLMDEPEWNSISNKQLLKSIKFRGSLFKDTAMVKKLWEMYISDQAYYSDINFYDNLYGYNNSFSDSLWILKNRINKINQKNLINILNKISWPKKSEYGRIASNAAFLVIQHSDYTLQKKYLPVIEECCKKNEADWEDYCLMLDRILVSENKPQIYGSQVKMNSATNKQELYPIENPHEVDKRRKEKGLIPLNDYLVNFNIRHDVPQNK